MYVKKSGHTVGDTTEELEKFSVCTGKELKDLDLGHDFL